MLRLPTENDRPEAVILADGEYPSGQIAAALLHNATRVVCCDGAAERFTRRGGVPYAIVGDGDSLPPELAARYAAILHRDADQESNDLTKAVRFCLAEGLHRIVLLGATGRREDHTVGNIGLLEDYAALGAEVSMVTDYGVFDPIAGETTAESRPGQQVSLFTSDPRTAIRGEGLKYPLPPRLRHWWCGTLNEALGTSFTVRIDGTAVLYRLF